jgi:hypothetical protein
VRLILDPSALPIHVHRFAVERDSSGIQTLQRDLVGSREVELRVAYTMQRPPEHLVDKYIDVLGVEPEFGAAQNCLIADKESLTNRCPRPTVTRVRWRRRRRSNFCGNAPHTPVSRVCCVIRC